MLKQAKPKSLELFDEIYQLPGKFKIDKSGLVHDSSCRKQPMFKKKIPLLTTTHLTGWRGLSRCSSCTWSQDGYIARLLEPSRSLQSVFVDLNYNNREVYGSLQSWINAVKESKPIILDKTAKNSQFSYRKFEIWLAYITDCLDKHDYRDWDGETFPCSVWQVPYRFEQSQLNSTLWSNKSIRKQIKQGYQHCLFPAQYYPYWAGDEKTCIGSLNTKEDLALLDIASSLVPNIEPSRHSEVLDIARALN